MWRFTVGSGSFPVIQHKDLCKNKVKTRFWGKLFFSFTQLYSAKIIMCLAFKKFIFYIKSYVADEIKIGRFWPQIIEFRSFCIVWKEFHIRLTNQTP